MTEHVAGYYRHGLTPMTGRLPHERGRAASPLELIFDLVFAAAFGVAGAQLAHGVEVGHPWQAVAAFVFGAFGIIWAWINYSWFASAFDTDDWLFRVLTMVQMSGVIVLAMGLPTMFASLDAGQALDNRVMVAGYVVMRVAMVLQWLRAARSERYRTVARTYAVFVTLAQIGWVAVAVLPLYPWQALIGGVVCWAIEMLGPVVSEAKGMTKGGGGTPWHPHHIAERYSLLTIITIGETVIGTIAAAQLISERQGWTFDTIVVIGAGMMMAFALWWTYFMVPSGPVLAVDRSKAFPWGYGHILVFMSIAAVGAGLHLIPYAYDDESQVTPLIVLLFIGVPVMIYSFSLFGLHSWLVGMVARNAPVQSLASALPVVGIVLSAVGVPMWVCILLVLASPVSVIFSYECGGWQRLQQQLDRVVAAGPRHTPRTERLADQA